MKARRCSTVSSRQAQLAVVERSPAQDGDGVASCTLLPSNLGNDRRDSELAPLFACEYM